MAGETPLLPYQQVKIHNDAIEKAAAFLERTAADYDEMALRAMPGPISAAKVTPEARVLSEKARLLRGQAGHIREMKLNIK